jgi:hypothetical protein
MQLKPRYPVEAHWSKTVIVPRSHGGHITHYDNSHKTVWQINTMWCVVATTAHRTETVSGYQPTMRQHGEGHTKITTGGYVRCCISNYKFITCNYWTTWKASNNLYSLSSAGCIRASGSDPCSFTTTYTTCPTKLHKMFKKPKEWQTTWSRVFLERLIVASLACQEVMPAVGHYPEPDEYSLHPYTLCFYSIHFNIILPYRPWSP